METLRYGVVRPEDKKDGIDFEMFTIFLQSLSFIKQVDISPQKIKQLDNVNVNVKALTYANIKSVISNRHAM